MFCLSVWLGYAPSKRSSTGSDPLNLVHLNRKVADIPAALGRVPPELTAPLGNRAFRRGSGVRPSGPLQ